MMTEWHSAENAMLSDEQEALLDLLLAEEGLDEPVSDAIPRRDSAEGVALTPAQARIWFLQQLDPRSHTYLIPTVVRLRLPLNPSLLNEAWQALFERHSILSTQIVEQNGRVVQFPHRWSAPDLELVDFTALDGLAQEQAVDQALTAARTRVFDWSSEPLVSATLLRLADDEHLFVLVAHHILVDGWSVNLLLDELTQIYAAKVAQTSAELPPLSIEYADYAAWQQAQAESPDHQRQLAYWRERLAAPLPQTELPTDFARPSQQHFDGGQERLTLSPTLTRDLHALARRTGATLTMVMLAAFKTVVARQTGQRDVVVGSPVAGRQRPELEPLVGLFLNTLVLRTDVDPDASFEAVVGAVRTTCVEAYANQDVAFEQLLIELQPERDLGRAPFFQIFFNMMQFDSAEATMPNPRVERVPTPDLDAKFDLTVYVEPVGDQIELTLVYNRTLFRPERMADLARQYEQLLTQAAANPAQAVKRYSLLTATAKAKLPDPTAPLSTRWEGSIGARLDAWATQHPGRTAVVDATRRWAMADLAANSSRLAHALQSKGVERGDVVAIFGQRCAALVSAVVGVLKAGAATLILDPAYPDQRLIDYLAAARPSAWLTFADAVVPEAVDVAAREFVGEAAFMLPRGPVAFATAFAAHEAIAPTVDIQPDDLASLTFTSGSTGKPKAVMGRHGSLTHFYPWMSERFGFSAEDRFAMLSGLAHDPLQRDLFTALWAGAEICVPDPQQMWSPGYLADWLRARRVTVAHLIPSMIHVLASQDSAEIPDLRLAFFVGETLTRHSVARLQAMAPNVTVVNLYGASETQRAVAYHVVESAANEAGQPHAAVPLGQAMPGAQLLVLNEAGALASIGEEGELVMRSPHVALGYWQDGEATARVFEPDSAEMPSACWRYHTGDRGRYLPNGEVVFAGRRDGQLNLRGFRLEPSEVEAALLTLPAIEQAAVVARSAQGDEPMLVAYVVVARGQTRPSARDVQAHVAARLPAAMVPSAVVALDALPLTPNGKLAVDQLPQPTTISAETPDEAPRDAIEAKMVTLWQEALQVETVGLHDDFFALGGHSLLAVQLFSQLREAFGVELNLGVLFRAPTVAALSEQVRRQISAETVNEPALDSNVVPVRKGAPGQPTFFCVHGAGGNVLFMQAWQAHFADWGIYGIESPNVDGLFEPNQSVEAISAEYVRQIQQVQPHGPYLLGGYSGGGMLAYEMAQQLRAQGDEVAMLVLIDTYHTTVGSRPYTWSERVGRIFRQPLAVVRGAWRRRVVAPLTLTYLLTRYVNRGKRVPLAWRPPLLTYFFVQAKWRYEPKPLDVDVLLVRSEEMGPTYQHVDQALGWRNTIPQLQIADVSGNHFTIVLEPVIGEVASAVVEAWQARSR